MFCHVPPGHARLRRPRRSAACLRPACRFLHRVSFRWRRRRPACGATLFRAYRMCACARVRAGAVCAPDCARARRRAHVSRPFRWVFFAPARGRRRSGFRMPLGPDLFYHRFVGIKYLSGIISNFVNEPILPVMTPIPPFAKRGRGTSPGGRLSGTACHAVPSEKSAPQHRMPALDFPRKRSGRRAQSCGWTRKGMVEASSARSNAPRRRARSRRRRARAAPGRGRCHRGRGR